MTYRLLTSYVLGDGRTLTEGSVVTQETFSGAGEWDDTWDTLVSNGTVVSEDDLPALEELGSLDDQTRDELLLMAELISPREEHRRRLRRDGRTDDQIELILGNDDELQSQLAEDNTPTPPTDGANDRETEDGTA